MARCSWCVMKPLAVPRCFAGLVPIANRLYLIGGRTKSATSIGAVDEYLEDCDRWETVAQLRVPRHDFGCCAVAGTVRPSPFSVA